jgi:hypothetical protein
MSVLILFFSSSQHLELWNPKMGIGKTNGFGPALASRATFQNGMISQSWRALLVLETAQCTLQ